MEWHRMTDEIPPEGRKILLWLHYGECGDPMIGTVMSGGTVVWFGLLGVNKLHKAEYRSTLWAEIIPPEGEIER